MLPLVKFFYTHIVQFENDCGNMCLLSWSQGAELGLLFHGLQELCERGANKMMGRETEEGDRDVIHWWLSIHQQQSINNWK